MFEVADLKDFLDSKIERYLNPEFIISDPISIPHSFTLKEDIEISAFLTATIAWGNRKAIIKSANQLMELMDLEPYSFIVNASNEELKLLNKFVYRTFQNQDVAFFVNSLRNIYQSCGGLENLFLKGYLENKSIKESIVYAREVFMQTDHLVRSEKHFSNPAKGAAAKRLNMFLRWMVRKDDKGVDFGIWDRIDMADLLLPLDVHTARVGRKLGVLNRKQNDWQAVEEITAFLKQLNPKDPVVYDFALFGLGVFEKF